jgi:predicted nucleic acid-binding protein
VISYVDTSVILRWVLGQPDALPHPAADAVLVTSRLTTVEATRSLDRMRRQGKLSEGVYAERLGTALRMLGRIDRVHLHVAVLRRAGDPFPVPLGTLDALHLATALVVRDRRADDVTIATHDAQLAAAARSVGLDVAGEVA